jgi:hypothetical protein
LIALLSPTMIHRCSICSLRARFSASSLLCRRAFLTASSVFSRERGFSTKSWAPIRTALTAVSIVPWPEITTTGTSGSRVRIRERVSSPSVFGSQTSRRMRSKRRVSSAARHASPLSTASGRYPSSERIPTREVRTPDSSSTMRMDSRMISLPVSFPPQAGSSTTNRAPRGGLSSTRITPWCSWTMRLTIARPSPLPRLFVEK